MGSTVWQHTECGYIHHYKLTCGTCLSRVIYANEKQTWCPYCKKYLEGVASYTRCEGCGKTNISKSEVKYLPF